MEDNKPSHQTHLPLFDLSHHRFGLGSLKSMTFYVCTHLPSHKWGTRASLCWENQDELHCPLCLLSWLPGSTTACCCLGFFFFLWSVGDCPLVHPRKGFWIVEKLLEKIQEELIGRSCFLQRGRSVHKGMSANECCSCRPETGVHIKAMSSTPHIPRLLLWIMVLCQGGRASSPNDLIITPW